MLTEAITVAGQAWLKILTTATGLYLVIGKSIWCHSCLPLGHFDKLYCENTTIHLGCIFMSRDARTNGRADVKINFLAINKPTGNLSSAINLEQAKSMPNLKRPWW